MKNYKLKFKKNVIYNEILRYKSNKPCWEAENDDENNQKRSK